MRHSWDDPPAQLCEVQKLNFRADRADRAGRRASASKLSVSQCCVVHTLTARAPVARGAGRVPPAGSVGCWTLVFLFVFVVLSQLGCFDY